MWKLDETSGIVARDSSENGHHGKLRGDFSFDSNSTKGRFENALDFDGDNDRIIADSVSLPIGAFTIALWFNPDIDLNKECKRIDFVYWERDSRPHLTFNKLGSGEIGIYASVAGKSCNDIISKTTTWDATVWYHIAATFDGKDFKIYVNGNLENTVEHAGLHDSDTVISFGSKPSGKNAFDGKLDDIRIYSYALGGDEIAAIYSSKEVALVKEKESDKAVTSEDQIPTTEKDGSKKYRNLIAVSVIFLVAVIGVALARRKSKGKQ